MSWTTTPAGRLLRATRGFLERQQYLWSRYLDPLYPEEAIHWVPTRGGWRLRGEVLPPAGNRPRGRTPS